MDRYRKRMMIDLLKAVISMLERDDGSFGRIHFRTMISSLEDVSRYLLDRMRYI